MGETSQDFQQMGVEFQNQLREFIERTDGLSKNSLKRVCKALAAHPLEEDLITLAHVDEEEVYEIGKEIQSIKLNMMVESLKQDAEEQRIKEAQQERANKVPDNIEKPDYAKEE
jgi:hydroxylamine reductase (hybrid-cluster protein)